MTLVDNIARMIYSRTAHGNVVYTAGNGGSHSQSEHFTAELMGKFQKVRRPISSFCLGSNSSLLTCIANDFGYDEVFSRQVSVMSPGDILFLMSTSGESENLLTAAEAAHDLGVTVVSITDPSSHLSVLSDFVLPVIGSTASKQEHTLTILHSICAAVEELFDE